MAPYLPTSAQQPIMKHRISTVTTRTGDSGTTRLADGTQVAKTDSRIVALGTVDELNSFVGLLVT